MDDTGFINKKNSCGVVVLKGSSYVLSNFSDVYFYMTFVVRVYASKYVAPPPLIIPANDLIGMLSKVSILRVLTLQQHHNVLPVLLYS